MNINLTLIGQTLTFALFVWFTMRFIWPPLVRVLDARQKSIADGLAAGERGKRELELAEQRKDEVLRAARAQASETLAQAEKRATEIVEEAKAQAKVEADRIRAAAQTDIAQEINRAKEQLRVRVAELAVVGAARIIEKEIDPKAHAQMLAGVVSQL